MHATLSLEEQNSHIRDLPNFEARLTKLVLSPLHVTLGYVWLQSKKYEVKKENVEESDSYMIGF